MVELLHQVLVDKIGHAELVQRVARHGQEDLLQPEGWVTNLNSSEPYWLRGGLLTVHNS